MFDQVLDLVKQHLGNSPEITSAMPAGQADEVHKEVANQITSGLANQASAQGGVGGLLSQLQNAATSGNPVTSAIEGGIASSIGSRFGLPPMVTGAITAALPGLLQKFAHKANDPNDNSITPESITKSLPGGLGGVLGSFLK